ncbi:hypothetical protein SELMODRAFT_169592 [Selaginella moellendorffii]|uniref:Pyroglutamyl-peptidase I n=1 Tax=Selaginella moellendorffii TaxID=88036 RepID=D8R9B1_SELML|nr:pyrrolidone-carboxylate peptidase isoform X2 [Selaginella moellendorffii]EFJ31126.1 hypothetical protein SELMODRAFT_169592 [Selaginella moellendorffii]|eukprot:XP_002967779.1 pyrrolidone-carboxylate peptidase isoform X2 [Selaginella moellendorffii]
MGSEGVPVTRIHVTGFKKFHGVAKNPTEVIVGRLSSYFKDGGLPQGFTLESATVLETAGEGALPTLMDLLDAAISPPSSSAHRKLGSFIEQPDPSSGRVLWIHFGVNSGASRFAIERRAVNEATFRCPDEMGWQPQRLQIAPEDGPLSATRETTLPAAEIVRCLASKGFEVTLSDDAGRFVCNYVYYQSLRHARANGTVCIFVHVPLFSRIEEDVQMQFVASLMEVLAQELQ